MKKSIALLLSVFVLVCLPKASFAHSVYIFAWTDGPQICTESYFTQKSKVRGGEVRMLDASGALLDSGFSGEDGVYCFSSPQKPQPLFFEIHAGPGHKGSFSLEERDVAEAVAASKTRPANQSEKSQDDAGQGVAVQPHAEKENTSLADPSKSGSEASQATDTVAPAQTPLAEDSQQSAPNLGGGDATSTEAIRAIVRDELQRQLSPMRHYLAEKLEDTTPGLREIVGGMGWLVGLGALGFWFSQRRRG